MSNDITAHKDMQYKKILTELYRTKIILENLELFYGELSPSEKEAKVAELTRICENLKSRISIENEKEQPKNRQVIARSHLKTEGKLLKETLGYNLLGRFEKDSICQARNDSFQIYKRNSVVSIVKIRKRVR